MFIFTINILEVFGAEKFKCYPGSINVCTNIKLIAPEDVKLKIRKNILRKGIIKKERENLIGDKRVLNFRKVIGAKIANKKTISMWNNVLRKTFETKQVKEKLLSDLVSNTLLQFGSSDSNAIMKEFVQIQKKHKIDFSKFSFFRTKILKINILKNDYSIVIDLTVDKRYASILWNTLTAIYRNDKHYFDNDSLPSDENTVDAEMSRIANDFKHSIASQNKNQFINVLDNRLEKVINIYISSIRKENPEAFKKAINTAGYFMNQLEYNYKMEKYNIWKKVEIEKFHRKIKRNVYVVNSRKKRPPRIDRNTGDLYLHKEDFLYLSRNGMLPYLMMHEAVHVYSNGLGSNRYFKSALQNLPMYLSKSFESACLNSKNNYFCDGQIQDSLKDIPVKEISDFYAGVMPVFKGMSEIFVDTTVLDSITPREKINYIKMLKYMLPSHESERISILSDYINLQNDIKNLNVSNENLFMVFSYLSMINSENSKKPTSKKENPDEFIKTLSNGIFSLRSSQIFEEKTIWKLFYNTVKIEVIYSFTNSYFKIKRIINKYNITNRILIYSNNRLSRSIDI